jgi:uncharacterized protein
VAAGERGAVAMLQALLDAGAAANVEQLGRALVAAAGSGTLEAFQLLLAHGADINARDFSGHTVLMAAAASGFPAMVREILKFHPDVNAAAVLPPPPCTPPTGASAAGKCEPSWDDGHTALMEAARRPSLEVPPEGVDQLEVVRLLLAAGANVNARDRLGLTPLAFGSDSPEIALLLLNAGADPNVRDYRGETALDRAYNDEVKRILIEHGAVRSARTTKNAVRK